jgi:hypothetical protein
MKGRTRATFYFRKVRTFTVVIDKIDSFTSALLQVGK